MPIAITVTPKSLQLGASFNTHVSITNPNTTTGYDFILTLRGRKFGEDPLWSAIPLQTSAAVHVNANSTVTYDFVSQVTELVCTAQIMVRGTLVSSPATYENSNIEQITISAGGDGGIPWIPIIAGLGAVAIVLVVLAVRKRK